MFEYFLNVAQVYPVTAQTGLLLSIFFFVPMLGMTAGGGGGGGVGAWGRQLQLKYEDNLGKIRREMWEEIEGCGKLFQLLLFSFMADDNCVTLKSRAKMGRQIGLQDLIDL